MALQYQCRGSWAEPFGERCWVAGSLRAYPTATGVGGGNVMRDATLRASWG